MRGLSRRPGRRSRVVSPGTRRGWRLRHRWVSMAPWQWQACGQGCSFPTRAVCSQCLCFSCGSGSCTQEKRCKVSPSPPLLSSWPPSGPRTPSRACVSRGSRWKRSFAGPQPPSFRSSPSRGPVRTGETLPLLEPGPPPVTSPPTRLAASRPLHQQHRSRRAAPPTPAPTSVQRVGTRRPCPPLGDPEGPAHLTPAWNGASDPGGVPSPAHARLEHRATRF